MCHWQLDLSNPQGAVLASGSVSFLCQIRCTAVGQKQCSEHDLVAFKGFYLPLLQTQCAGGSLGNLPGVLAGEGSHVSNLPSVPGEA